MPVISKLTQHLGAQFKYKHSPPPVDTSLHLIGLDSAIH
jgi:hypothetical protein